MLYDFWSNKGDSDRSEVLRKALVEDWTQLDRSNFQTSADIRRIFFRFFYAPCLLTRLTTVLDHFASRYLGKKQLQNQVGL